MERFIVLRLDAPLMAFGGVKVDDRGPTDLFPGKALVTGLIGNALGYDHREAGRLARLQERLLHGVRRDSSGRIVTDYQTVDLGQPHLHGWRIDKLGRLVGEEEAAAGSARPLEVKPGWTTRDEAEGREGGSAREGTAIRLRQYIADAHFTVVLRLSPPDEAPTLDDLVRALERPERPLFIGRKPCMPSGPLLAGCIEAPSMWEALQRAPAADARRGGEGALTSWLPGDEPSVGPSRDLLVADERDWVNQVVVGSRLVKQVNLPRAGEGA